MSEELLDLDDVRVAVFAKVLVEHRRDCYQFESTLRRYVLRCACGWRDFEGSTADPKWDVVRGHTAHVAECLARTMEQVAWRSPRKFYACELTAEQVYARQAVPVFGIKAESE